MRYIASAIFVLAVAVAMFSIQDAGEKTYSVEEVLNNSDSLEGQNITVRGDLYQRRAICTQMACLEEQCCNTCSAPLRLGKNKSLNLRGENIGCSGTNCELNCTPETGKNYFFEGKIQERRGNMFLRIYEYERSIK